MKRILDWRSLTVMLVLALGVIVTCCDGNPDGGVAVDLGLPSGTLWADRNVGANSPEDCGDYFAWGETEPKNINNWSPYKWASSLGYLKYNTKKGFGDYKITLDPEDDAATANWGNAWCMPTEEQIYELAKECTWTTTTQNGVIGFKVTGPNGKSIFLPAAGYLHYSIHSDDSAGFYWSRSLVEGESDVPMHLRFYPEYGAYLDSYYRSCCLPVRAVRADN